MATFQQYNDPLDAQGPSRTMQKYGIYHILVCLDSSSSSDLCLDYALSFATTFGSSVTLLHVMQAPNDRVGPHSTDVLSWEIARQQANTRLERFEKEAKEKSGLQINIRLEQGRPAERIVALTRKLKVDLVVLCGHGENSEEEWNLGSTALNVLAMARSSVLLTNGSAVVPFSSPKRILLPLDGSSRTESVLPIAVGIASKHNAELLLVHVVADPLPTGILVDADDLKLAHKLALRLESKATLYLEGLRHKIGYKDSLVRTIVSRQADKRQFLIDLSEKEQVDLMILSAHGSTCNAVRPFGSVASHILTHSRIPILVLQDLPESEFHNGDEAVERLAPLLRTSHPPEGD